MTAANAIRFLHSEAAKCRDRDACEALCLLLPALLKVFNLDPMEDVEAAAFRYQFREELHRVSAFQDATDRSDARPVHLAQSMRQTAADERNRTPNLRRPGQALPEPAGTLSAAPGARLQHAPAA
jgi:hypothetical protein